MTLARLPQRTGMTSENRCQTEACAIQSCLLKHDYDETRCRKAVEQLYKCCDAMYAEHGTAARSRCCPLPQLLRDKMRQLGM